jgi:hypothetical protein
MGRRAHGVRGIRIGGLALVVAVTARCERPIAPAPQALRVEFLADANVAPGEAFRAEDGAALGGISGIAYRPERKTWLALSDARTHSRFYELKIEYDPQGETLAVTPIRETRLTDEAGAPFSEGAIDPEGLAPSPWETLLVSTEPDTRPEPAVPPQLFEIDLEGRLKRRVEVPEKFLTNGSPTAYGARHNLGFEALTVSRDGSKLFVGVEDTLHQDGPIASFQSAGFCRILTFSLPLAGTSDEIRPEAEYVYPLGPFAREQGFEEPVVSGGLVELSALADGRLLALERVFVRDGKDRSKSLNRVRIYALDLEFATNVSELSSLDGASEWTPVRKELVADLDDFVDELSPGFQMLDNFEAMGLGPELPGGGRSLLVVSDDNFQQTQRTAFLLFRLTGD